jgi:hypothetical protein
MVYIALYLKIDDWSEFFMRSLAHHLFFVFVSVWSHFFQFHPLTKHSEAIDLQLKSNRIKKTLMTKIKYTMLSTAFYERVNSVGCIIFTLHVLIYN